jgi:feruloyl-CoA synthase
LIDESHPEKGIAFNGRVSEDFKLTTGTWVSVGTLRTNLVSSFTPYAQDFVICGHNQDEVGALMFPTPALKELAGDGADSLPPHRWIEIASVRDELEKRMRSFKEEYPGSSQHIRVLRLLDTPPNMAAGEITDKGYLNQRTSLLTRADQVASLFEENCEAIIRI